MLDKSKDQTLKQYEEKINQQLIEVIEADPLNAPIAMMRAGLARIMLRYILTVTKELGVSIKQIEDDVNKMLE